jgi:hypothetical protein
VEAASGREKEDHYTDPEHSNSNSDVKDANGMLRKIP